MDINQISSLFHRTNNLLTTYKRISEISGESFNVFRVLKVESSEVRMHSAFLAELLNPKGSHGQKHIFLKLFIDLFCFKGNTIDPTSCKVEIESYIGLINENATKGGRVDIIITDNNHNKVIIENKIYAGDQENQLLRYFNHAKDADIIYLTLDGRQPTELSKGGLEEGLHFKCFSYKHDILKWLDFCRKEVANNPIVREGITHYINLIKYLTNQTINQSMNKEINELIISNLEASFVIADNLDNACAKALEIFCESIKNECAILGLECSNNVDFSKNYTGIWICKPEWEFLNIGIQFHGYDRGLVYGICLKVNPEISKIPKIAKEVIFYLPNNELKKISWFLFLKRFDSPYNDWSKYQAWKAIENGSMKTIMIEKILYLLNELEGLLAKNENLRI